MEKQLTYNELIEQVQRLAKEYEQKFPMRADVNRKEALIKAEQILRQATYND